ncbi:hypothetical protein C2G38_2226458 [Gigaspora rosea]|uniref:Uncharacterized protein n=1 Tax=Gigaspora rosea TaxID=44941 RepID=A0A397TY49_9GLOM|nr:hypothetical protein C2G38_2226458 [Gigaspora rosea]
MANLYEKVITKLLFYNNNNQVSDPIIIPYDPLQDYKAQTIAIYIAFFNPIEQKIEKHYYEYTQKRKKEDESAQLESDVASESINDNVMFDVPKDDQNSRNSLFLLKSAMTSLPQTEVNTQLNMEIPSQTVETIPDEIGNAKKIEVNNNQHVTKDMEIDEQNDTQSETHETEVEERRNEQMSYSGAVKKSLPQRRERQFKEIDMQWADHVMEKLVQSIKDPFDKEEWHYGQIIEALKNEELLCKFITHKLYTIPTRHEMPKAIQLKFIYQDRSFFHTFTRNTKIMPAHQIEFEAMFDKVIQNYKDKHSITVTNREIRDQINRFMKLPEGLQSEIVWKTVNKAIQTILLPLPEKPEDIPKDVRELLLFEIPIKNRNNLRSLLAALRKVYTFAQLPDEYFTELEPLPDNPWELCEEVKGLFPIIDRKDLRKVYGYKQRLAEHYKLPEKKIPLPLTPQELNHKYRTMFPIDLTRSNRTIKEISDMLREIYFFKFIPNDFFIQKPRLPRDIKRIITQSKYNFSIEDKEEAIRFIEKISVSLTTPITTTEQLVEIVRSLRPLYYFHRIPETWIEIKRNQNPSKEAEENQKEMKIDMPENLEEVQNRIHIATHNAQGINEALKYRNWIESCWDNNLYIVGMTETKLAESGNYKLFLANPYYEAYMANSNEQVMNRQEAILGYNLEWELSGKVVSGDTDKSKEPGKWKPIWKVPSKKVATIFDGATRTRISETGDGELDDMTFKEEGPPTWPPESYRSKRTYVLELGTRGRKTIVAPNAG